MSAPRHPYRLASSRRLADADPARHIADLVRLVLLTAPGGRLHRPDFGAGLGADALFQPMGAALAGLVEMRARGALISALGDRIAIESLTVQAAAESAVEVVLVYRLRDGGEPATVTVRSEVPA
jgi:hypothetical protein